MRAVSDNKDVAEIVLTKSWDQVGVKDVVLFGSDNLIGYNWDVDIEEENLGSNYHHASLLEPKIKIIPVNYYGCN